MIRINQFVRSRWRLRQNPQPAERIIALIRFQNSCRNRLAANSMKPVASRNKIALKYFRRPVFFKPNRRLFTLQPLHTHISRLKNNFSARVQPRRNQILDHFVLGVDHHALAARQIRKIDAVPASAKSQLYAVVHQSLPHHPLAQAKLVQQVHGSLFQHTCPHSLFDVLPRLRFQHDAPYSRPLQQVRQY